MNGVDELEKMKRLTQSNYFVYRTIKEIENKLLSAECSRSHFYIKKLDKFIAKVEPHKHKV